MRQKCLGWLVAEALMNDLVVASFQIGGEVTSEQCDRCFDIQVGTLKLIVCVSFLLPLLMCKYSVRLIMMW